MDQHVGIVTLKVEILQVHLNTIRAGSHNILARQYGAGGFEHRDEEVRTAQPAMSEVGFSSNLAYPDESGRHRNLAKPSSDAP